MKSNEFITEETLTESKMLKHVLSVIRALEDEIAETVKSKMTDKRLTMMKLKDQEVSFNVVSYNPPSSRVWTRGDGSRYKEPGKISVMDTFNMYQRKYSTFKKLFPDKAALLDHIWKVLADSPKAKDIGTVSGEFSRDEWHEAITAAGILWIKRPWAIEFGSPSRLKNKNGVWHTKPPEGQAPQPTKGDLVKVVGKDSIKIRGYKTPITLGNIVKIKDSGQTFSIKAISDTEDKIKLSNNRVFKAEQLTFPKPWGGWK